MDGTFVSVEKAIDDRYVEIGKGGDERAFLLEGGS
jgi:hypothetical protein